MALTRLLLTVSTTVSVISPAPFRVAATLSFADVTKFVLSSDMRSPFQDQQLHHRSATIHAPNKPVFTICKKQTRLAPARRVLVQESDQASGRFRRTPPTGHYVPVLQFLAVERGVVIQILPQGGSFESKTGKQALGPRPRENLRVHLSVGLSRRRASHGTGGN